MSADPRSAVSVGALRRIYNGEQVQGPVLQCLQHKQLTSNANGQDRYRCVWSDTINFIQSMLGTNMNHLIQSEKIRRGVFVRINQYQTSEIKGKKIMVALDVEVMENLGVHEKVGEPESLENTENSGVGVKQEEDRKPQPGAISGGNFYGNSNGNGAHVKQESTSRSLPPKSAAGGGGTSAHGNIYPIESLSPYAHKWTIKARCTVKSDIKTWHKQTGEGKLFSVTFMDETGEIRATGFNEQVDQLYEVFQPGSVYYISSPCRVQIAKKQFSNVNNDYELTFERDTAVEKAEEDNSVPSIRYNFTNIQDLQKVEANSTVDLVGVIKDVGEVSQITSKSTGKPYDKREISLVDNSGFSVRMTLWGNTAQSFEGDPDQVVAFKGVKVSDFGGRSCSLLSSGTMAINPDIDEAHRLKGWYDAQGNTADFTTHSSTMGTTNAGGRKDVYKTTKQVQDENLGMSEQADYFTLKATVVYIKSDNIAYPACQSEGCNKKIVEINPGEWRCERCDKSFEKPQYRYIISANVSDHTGQIWLSCFDEVGRMMLGMDGNDLMDMKENDERAFGEKVANANCQTWIFRCRAKMDTFQDQTRVRYQVSNANPVDYAQEAKRLAELIKQYSINDNDSNSMFVS